MRIRFILCIMTCVLTSASAQVRLSLSDGWQFVRTDMGSIWEVLRPAKAGKPESVPLWTSVSLPHCYNAEDGVDPSVNYYQGPAWYRTTLHVANPYLGGHTLLQLEGADVDAPHLYTARITYGEQIIEKRFGFRSFKFEEHGPFYLNGRRLLLQGTHRHEDHAGVGAAMTDDMIRREMQVTLPPRLILPLYVP